MKRKIEFYRTDKSCPVEDFFDTLDDNVVAKIFATFKYIEELVIIPEKFFKKLNKDIYEIRVKVGSNIYRILCFFHKESLVILTNGFQKKTQKTPINEIGLAIKYKTEYIGRLK
ncbi:MAG: hypothetical protein A2015_01495 [Spirochaetes bacterium GWF1_31_7]|nr:MAG: hypothetical protein A2Y29_09430 [Spirochaetes bacterium GWE2_31_10]OHD51135.1 MAG: hypothetical protein A2015_01495 [Spirochaetes bacterium GWF1_31_7]OHD80028.1 MAG: hypothetical protein A2355_09470 [Spirochaetes bacterium RIFOXYB1_FULL_32_8]HBD95033.1 hypothetical protein [Spirochaetia bacterium]HBI38982.1 hypothetical protein [Spirochaetia bacterium]